MKEPMYKKYADKGAVGVLPLDNFGGLEILDIEYGIDDYVIACFNFGNGRQKIRRHKIQYTNTGRNYIKKEGVRYYFDDILRVC